MNTKTISTIMLLISSLVIFGQNQIQILSEYEENEHITEIRKKFNEINSKPGQLEAITKNIDDCSASGGELKAYYHQKQLKKVVATYFGETGKAIIDYYFDNDHVFFIFRQDFQYNSPMYVVESDPEMGIEAFDSNKTKIEENRYYFTNNKLIRWLDNSKKKKLKTTPEFLEKQAELNADIAFIRSKL